MGSRIKRIRAYVEILLASVIVVALFIQFIYGLEITTLSSGSYIEQFFSYFTILSNLFVASVFVIEAIATLEHKSLTSRFDSVRGAAVFCILTTGLVYSLFLRGPGGQGEVVNSIPWINAVFHYIVPTIAALDWFVFPPKHRVNWSTIFNWLGLTIVYFILVEIGGYFTKTYPYFFLDPTKFRGYSGVLMGSATFLPFFLVFGFIVIASSNFQQRFRHH
jgi:hypothetical protein